MKFRKAFVDVILHQDIEGKTRPLSLIYDGKTYTVDRVRDVRRAASTKVGGSGIRYTIVVNGQESFLFEDEGHWFVEAKIPR